MANQYFPDNKPYQIIASYLQKEFQKSSLSSFQRTMDSINIFAALTHVCLHCTTTNHRLTMADVITELRKSQTLHLGVEVVSLQEIKSATNCFNNQNVIAKGSSGTIYKGELTLTMGLKVFAVKRFDEIDCFGENAFLKKVTMFSLCVHDNIMPLRGFCEEDNEKIIIMEHASNGSLDGHINKSSLTWGLRLKIAISVAKGLSHIHSLDNIQSTYHGDIIKTSKILLDGDWKASILYFVTSKGHDRLGYLDPLLLSDGATTTGSDFYAFGVVLFQILSGKLAIEKAEKYPQDKLRKIISREQKSDAEYEYEDEYEDEYEVFLGWLAVRCYEDRILEEITFHDLKTQTESISIFSEVAYLCLKKDRPNMAWVISKLEEALNIHWVSLNKDGKTNELISATEFEYKNLRILKWRSEKSSRFSKVAKISETSDLNIKIQIKTKFLSEGVIYGAYLVFKFCDSRMVSSDTYVNLKYKTSTGSYNSYIAKGRDDAWKMIELCKFEDHSQIIDFEVQLKRFHGHSCGSGPIFIEGIEFQPIDDN
ncbi:probable serine/threonine-protein kinase PBL10 isoform X4 [Rutidosis leptorrhynchoides]|uniref:probable serine/threonine-protein kinase PBL10 isoform X4 n=1 Tax=Rutidosis leptorrhynchoides TaxID=125765 RepID=UPI003A98E00F